MKPLPQHLYDRAELLARSHQQIVVAEILRLRPATITIMKQRNWKSPDRDPRLKPVPSDFAIVSRRLTHKQLVKHYRSSSRTVSRWLAEKPRPRFKPGRKTVRG